MEQDIKREFFRHTLATVAYRGEKVLRDAPAGFEAFRASPTSRTPLEILGHLGDLFVWALSTVKGKTVWKEYQPVDWEHDRDRFFAALKELDDYLASDAEIDRSLEKLFQGPVADSLTHIGQIGFLRRMFDAPVRAENFVKAEIERGRVGRDQSANRLEFD
ncbi:MAG: hypothetical protein JSS81_01545 [Acidobacteria bacterium]|nr:hypothetical protein [Acidobacteriota bacterium]